MNVIWGISTTEYYLSNTDCWMLFEYHWLLYKSFFFLSSIGCFMNPLHPERQLLPQDSLCDSKTHDEMKCHLLLWSYPPAMPDSSGPSFPVSRALIWFGDSGLRICCSGWLWRGLSVFGMGVLSRCNFCWRDWQMDWDRLAVAAAFRTGSSHPCRSDAFMCGPGCLSLHQI